MTAWPGCRAGWTFPASDGPYVAHRREAKGILFAPWPLERSNCPHSTSILLIFGGLSYGVNLMPCRKLRHQQPLTGLEPALRLIKTALSPGKLQRHMPPAMGRRRNYRGGTITAAPHTGQAKRRRKMERKELIRSWRRTPQVYYLTLIIAPFSNWQPAKNFFHSRTDNPASHQKHQQFS